MEYKIMTNTLEHRAFESLLREKFPAINKNVLKEYQEKHNLFTMKDFLNVYGDLNNKTMNDLHSDIMKYLFSGV